MRAIFGVLSLLLVLAVVGLVLKKQLASSQQALPALTVPTPVPAKPAAAVQEQVRQAQQQIQQQYKQALDAAMQPARAVPDDK